jgi:leucyl-tRNA synthetase
MLGYTPNKSKLSSIIHVISCWPSQLSALQKSYISQSYNTQIKFAYKHENIKKNKSIVNHQTTIIVVPTCTFKIETKWLTFLCQLDANYLIIPISCIYSTNTTLSHLIK